MAQFAGLALAGPALGAPELAQGAATPTARDGRILRVGPARRLKRPAEAARAACDGDTIEIDAGNYRGDAAVWTRHGLTIRAVGGPVRLLAEGAAAEGKAIWVVRATGLRIEGIEFAGARVPTGNGAGIRFEAGSLVLERCRFLDNEMGVLTAGRPDMALAVHHCEFADAPRHDSGLLHHLLYVGAIGSCVVMHSRFHHGWRGHLINSRARVNRILFNELDNGDDGGASYELEFPDGGDAPVLGNRLVQSAASHNPAMLSMGAEGARPGADAAGRLHRLVLRGNRFVNHRPDAPDAPSRFVHLWPERLAGPLVVDAEGNVFDGPGVVGLP